jgi:hypothetical protein
MHVVVLAVPQESELDRVLAHNGIRAVFQPIVSLETRTVVASSARSRSCRSSSPT